MNYYGKLELQAEKGECLSFYLVFNEKTTFEDLLEFILYNFPDKNFCPCYKFQYSDSENKDKDKEQYNIIDNNLKIYDLISKKNYSLRISNIHPDKKCHCDSSLKNYYQQSKTNLIKIIQENSQNFKQKVSNDETQINALQNKDVINKSKMQELEEENNKLKEKNEKNEKTIVENEKIIDDLNKKIELLEAVINGNNEKLNMLKNLGISNEILAPISSAVSHEPRTNIIISNEKLNTIFTNFYDVIINIKSIKDITKGWEVKMSKRAEDNYKNFKNEKIIKVGVIGNSNKGKSFLLSKISKISLPSSIRTEGLSIKYPELELFKDRRIALLDSAGLETPVLRDDNFESNEEKSEKEIFKEKSREKIITDLFLQNYIIYNSDILLVVIGVLTYSEQKLLNRIKKEIQRRKIKKPLYVIHNLITHTTINQIKDYVNNFILKSATFDLEEGHKITTKLTNKNGTYYYEKNSEPKVYHLIFANEGSEAGEYYNNYTLEFLENEYQRVTDLQSFDVIKSIKKRFIELSTEIMEKIEKPVNMNDFDNGNNNKLIKLNNPKEIILKKCLIDELGFSNLKADGFEPTYNYYKKDDKIIVRVEAPGNSTINSTILPAGEYTFIRLSGLKKRDKEPQNLEDNMFNSREMGFYTLDIPLKSDDFLIKGESPKIVEKKGVLMLEYQMEEKKEDKGFSVENEI